MDTEDVDLIYTQGGVVRESYLLFSSGYANSLEVINAQSNALESELYMVDVGMQLLIANIELYRDLGGGWQ